jgi:hypothetical protein
VSCGRAIDAKGAIAGEFTQLDRGWKLCGADAAAQQQCRNRQSQWSATVWGSVLSWPISLAVAHVKRIGHINLR